MDDNLNFWVNGVVGHERNHAIVLTRLEHLFAVHAVDLDSNSSLLARFDCGLVYRCVNRFSD